VSTDLQILCDQLDDEIERQQNVGAVCSALHEALCARDADAIDARNHALELLAREAGAEADVRDGTIARIAKALGIDGGVSRLRDLADRAPEPWKSQLYERREILRNILQSNQRMIRRNELIASKSKALAESWRETLFGHFAPHGPAYCGNGQSQGAIQGAPAMIDQRG
jgi:hypothetical protein